MIRRLDNNQLIQGFIVETEAYSQEEESCHGYSKKTRNNYSLFGEPGTFYIYKSYGIHFCLNLVTYKINYASGVLIRSIFIENEPERVAAGPGLVTKRFNIDSQFNTLKSYDNKKLWLVRNNTKIKKEELIQTKRVGISKAIDLEWRWYLKSSRSVSKREKGDKSPILKNASAKLGKKL